MKSVGITNEIRRHEVEPKKDGTIKTKLHYVIPIFWTAYAVFLGFLALNASTCFIVLTRIILNFIHQYIRPGDCKAGHPSNIRSTSQIFTQYDHVIKLSVSESDPDPYRVKQSVEVTELEDAIESVISAGKQCTHGDTSNGSGQVEKKPPPKSFCAGHNGCSRTLGQGSSNCAGAGGHGGDDPEGGKELNFGCKGDTPISQEKDKRKEGKENSLNDNVELKECKTDSCPSKNNTIPDKCCMDEISFSEEKSSETYESSLLNEEVEGESNVTPTNPAEIKVHATLRDPGTASKSVGEQGDEIYVHGLCREGAKVEEDTHLPPPDEKAEDPGAPEDLLIAFRDAEKPVEHGSVLNSSEVKILNMPKRRFNCPATGFIEGIHYTVMKVYDVQERKEKNYIGKGAYGRVDLVKTKDGDFYARKRQLGFVSERETAELMNEIIVMERMMGQHPNVMQLVLAQKIEDILELFTCVAFGGTLFEYVSRVHEAYGDIKMEDKSSLCCQVGSAVNFLQEKRILHRDLKDDNILITGDGRPLVSDFGKAVKLPDDQHFLDDGYPVVQYYTCPEVARSEPYGLNKDCWAFGGIVKFIDTAKRPWHEILRPGSTKATLTYLIGSKPHPPYPGDSKFVDIYKGLFTFKDERMSIKEALKVLMRLSPLKKSQVSNLERRMFDLNSLMTAFSF